MQDQFLRTELLIGKNAVKKLSECRVAIFGIGGVGGYVCEALVRSGVGEFDLIDNDTVSVSNINRQIIALHSTVGQYKVDVMKARMLDINPQVLVHTYRCFFLPENADDFPFEKYDYVVDAVDTVTAKISIIMKAKENRVPVISAMGAGNKLDPTRFEIADIYDTSVCPLAKVMRRELKKRGVQDLKVVYSREEPLTPGKADRPNSCMLNSCKEESRNTDVPAAGNTDAPDSEIADSAAVKNRLNTGGNETNAELQRETFTKAGRPTPGSTAFVPSAAGLIMAGEIIKDLTGR